MNRKVKTNNTSWRIVTLGWSPVCHSFLKCLDGHVLCKTTRDRKPMNEKKGVTVTQ